MKTAHQPVTRFDDGEIFHTRRHCYVHRIASNFDTRTSFIGMGEFSCTDMGGAIELFRAIDLDVEAVVTATSKGMLDTVYSRDAQGKWRANDGRGTHWRSCAVSLTNFGDFNHG